jgi:hypothetical protein
LPILWAAFWAAIHDATAAAHQEIGKDEEQEHEADDQGVKHGSTVPRINARQRAPYETLTIGPGNSANA